MKITEEKIERIYNLRYNGGKVIPIALNENISEKLVRTILKKNYTTYAKVRAMTRPDYLPWSYLPLNGKPTATIQETSNQGDTRQDTNCSLPEHHKCSEKIKESEKIINTLKEKDQIKDKELQQITSERDNAYQERDKINEKNREYERVIQEKKQVISDLKEHHLNEHQLLQKDISEVKTTIHQGFIVVQENIGTLTKAHNQLNLSFQTHNTTTQEKNKLEQELQTLKEKHSNDLLKYGGVGVIGFSTGMLVDHFFPSLLDSFVTWIKEQIKNTNAGYTNTPTPQPGIIQPDIHYIHSGVTLHNTSGILWSGAFPTTYREVHSTGFNTVPNQQHGVIQPSLHSEVHLVTNPSGSQCSGAFYSSHAEIIPIQNVTPIQNSPPQL